MFIAASFSAGFRTDRLRLFGTLYLEGRQGTQIITRAPNMRGCTYVRVSVRKPCLEYFKAISINCCWKGAAAYQLGNTILYIPMGSTIKNLQSYGWSNKPPPWCGRCRAGYSNTYRWAYLASKKLQSFGPAAHQLGNPSSHTVTKVKQH